MTLTSSRSRSFMSVVTFCVVDFKNFEIWKLGIKESPSPDSPSPIPWDAPYYKHSRFPRPTSSQGSLTWDTKVGMWSASRLLSPRSSLHPLPDRAVNKSPAALSHQTQQSTMWKIRQPLIRMLNHPIKLWMLNWPTHCPVIYCIVKNCHDHARVGSCVHAVVHCLFRYCTKSVQILINGQISLEKHTTRENKLTFKSVLSSDIKPKLSPEKRAENIKQVPMMINCNQIGSMGVWIMSFIQSSVPWNKKPPWCVGFAQIKYSSSTVPKMTVTKALPSRIVPGFTF